MNRLPPVEDLLRAYGELGSFEKTAQKYGVGKGKVADVLRAAGVTPRDSRFQRTAQAKRNV